jgi:hypothetical protein
VAAERGNTFVFKEEGAFLDLPPLSCGGIDATAAIAVEESDSAAGQVLPLGGSVRVGEVSSTVHPGVDLATGLCTPGRPSMLARALILRPLG